MQQGMHHLSMLLVTCMISWSCSAGAGGVGISWTLWLPPQDPSAQCQSGQGAVSVPRDVEMEPMRLVWSFGYHRGWAGDSRISSLRGGSVGRQESVRWKTSTAWWFYTSGKESTESTPVETRGQVNTGNIRLVPPSPPAEIPEQNPSLIFQKHRSSDWSH